MNLSQIRNFTSLFANDPNQSRYSGQYTNVINQAQQQFALDSRCLFKDKAYSIVDATATYDLPSDFMFEKKVTFSTLTSPTGGKKLDPISRETLEFYIRSDDWSDDKGTPQYYMIDPEEARKQIRLFPIPQAADAGTSNLILTYYPLPTDLSGDTDSPLNGQSFLSEFHIAIACYAAWMLLQSEISTPEMLAKQAQLIRQYNDKVTDAIDRFGNTKSEPIRMRGGRYWK